MLLKSTWLIQGQSCQSLKKYNDEINRKKIWLNSLPSLDFKLNSVGHKPTDLDCLKITELIGNESRRIELEKKMKLIKKDFDPTYCLTKI